MNCAGKSGAGRILRRRAIDMMKKVLLARSVVQAIFWVLVLVRLHRETVPFLFALIPLAFIAGNFFCGWFCPLGAIQELLGNVGSILLGRKFKKLKMPRSVQLYAQSSKYALALLILILVALGKIGTDDANALPFDAYQSFFAIFDGRALSISAVVFLVFVMLTSLFVDRPFCNYLCMNSVEYALPSWTRVLTVKRDASICVKCGRCDDACPMNIRVSESHRLRNLQCINCFKCVAGCPASKALSYGKTDAMQIEKRSG
jgi:polyferredoxin